MSVYNDMASDAGYKYGTRENEQMAQMVEQQEQEEMYRQYQMQAETMAHAQAQGEYEQRETTMTEKQMTDEELKNNPMFAIDGYIYHDADCNVETNLLGGKCDCGMEDAFKKFSESRKGMFTAQDMEKAFNAGWTMDATDIPFDRWIEQYLTERKGR